MRVQVAICTWNRSRLLDRTLDAMRGLVVPGGSQLDFIIVDNASTDQTQSVLQRQREFLPISSIRESKPGHCFARNRAIQQAAGDLMVWTDDDIIPSNRWIEQYVTAAISHPETAFWGGPIIPQFDETRPAWMNENWDLCKACFAYRDLGQQPLVFSPSTLPYGANFAIRTQLQKQFLFDVKLGRRGHQVTGGDEIDLLIRVINDGHQGRWIPEAKVSHIIPPDRMKEAYIHNYYVGQGINEVLRTRQTAAASRTLKLEQYSQKLLYRLKRPYADSKIWLTHLVRSGLAKGKSIGLKQIRSGDDLPR